MQLQSCSNNGCSCPLIGMPCSLICSCMDLKWHGEVAVALSGRLMRFCGFLVSSLFSWNTSSSRRQNKKYDVMRDFFVFENNMTIKTYLCFFHAYVFYAPIWINVWTALDNLPLLSKCLRKDFCSGNARNQCSKCSCCWHWIFRGFGRGKVWLVSLCKKNENYTIFLYLDADISWSK